MTIEGWIALDKETGVGGMKRQQYEPKQFEETNIDIKISHCGDSVISIVHNYSPGC